VIKPPANQQELQSWDDRLKRWVVSSLWQRFFSDVFDAILALQSSGATADRPTKGLYVGRPYFDTTLGKPIWYSGSGWVDATGAAV
jgi:hypothetical protein